MAFSGRICILDGYVDEPSLLGVPPYISPNPRYIFGALKDALKNADIDYLTIDHYRADPEKRTIVEKASFLIVIAGCLVPGKYLSARPISSREIDNVVRHALENEKRVFIAGGFAKYRLHRKEWKDRVEKTENGGHDDATIFDIISGEDVKGRERSDLERRKWSVTGAEVTKQHPNFPERLIAEVETYRGCVRYRSGGCSFCQEPALGKPAFRPIDEIIEEIKAIYGIGVTKFRIGGQSCIFSYGTEERGTTETPRPNPSALRELFAGIRKECPGIEVLHVDNANPAVIAKHPEESREIAKILVENCTSGNVVAFGLESADPEVRSSANLNASAEQILEATQLLNEIGGGRGNNGMPQLLPGINLLFGLPGETKETFRINKAFLQDLLDSKLLVRRINIRQAVSPMTGDRFQKVNRREFIRFKKWTREVFDSTQLERMLPVGTILKDIYIEKHDGNHSFGRQLGSYPLLVGFRYKLPFERFDGSVVEHGQRSVTCIRYPLPVNQAKLLELQAVPGIGKKRAASIVRYRPYSDFDELSSKVELDDSVFDYSNLFVFK